MAALAAVGPDSRHGDGPISRRGWRRPTSRYCAHGGWPGPLPGGSFRYSDSEPSDINDAGEITGMAWRNLPNNPIGLLLTPRGD
jgi:hypothetical protein